MNTYIITVLNSAATTACLVGIGKLLIHIGEMRASQKSVLRRLETLEKLAMGAR